MYLIYRHSYLTEIFWFELSGNALFKIQHVTSRLENLHMVFVETKYVMISLHYLDTQLFCFLNDTR